MKKISLLNRITNSCMILLLCLISWHCSRDVAIIPTKSEISVPYQVNINDATTVAELYAASSNLNSRGARASANIVESKETIVDVMGIPLFYILNYKGGGFALVSADMRAMPILAYSETGPAFPKDAATANGLGFWLNNAKAQMKDIIQGSSKTDSIVIKEWKKFLKGVLNLPKGGRVMGNTNCQEWYTTGQYMCRNSSYFSHNNSDPNKPGPLLSYGQDGNPAGIFWGQNRIANYRAPSAGTIPCSSNDNASYCGRFPAGCGPVAMAQVLWYYKPNNYFDYNAMPQSSSSPDCEFSASGQLALAALMRTCGDAAESVYGFSGTCNTLTYPSKISPALSVLGLSNGGSLGLYSPSTMENEVYQGNPVILIGTNSDPVITGFDQHIWVCDGFYENRYSEYDCDTKRCNESSYLYLYNNWGFNGNGNGWYGTGNFRPRVENQGNYNQNVRMISGIRR